MNLDKLTENRNRATKYRGPLAIHAGLSLKWLQLDAKREYDERYGLYINRMAFGAVVGTVDLIDCVYIVDIDRGALDEKYPWLRSHKHATGPYCFIFANPVRFKTPIPFRGAQGFFNVPDSILPTQENAA
jgi:hypothetical protein